MKTLIIIALITISFVFCQQGAKTYNEFKDCIMKCQVSCEGSECIDNQDHQFITCYSSAKECHKWNSDYFNSSNDKLLDTEVFKECFNQCRPERKATIFYRMYACWRLCALGEEHN